MSDSDDTDVLLLIPPDLYLIPPDSDDDLKSSNKPGVVSELIEHVQSLESRISAIESRDSSFETPAIKTPLKRIFRSALTRSQSIPRTSHSVSQSASLQNTPTKPRRCSSVPSTPCSRLLSTRTTNEMQNEERFNDHANYHSLNANSFHHWKKHEDLTSPFMSSVFNPTFPRAVRTLHASTNISPPKKESHMSVCSNVNNSFAKTNDQVRRSLFSSTSSRKSTGNSSLESKKVDEMNLSEVDELLQDMEATELELTKRISASDSQKLNQNGIPVQSKKDVLEDLSSSNKPNFKNKSSEVLDSLLKFSQENKTSNSLQCDNSPQFTDPNKLISEFKVWKSMKEEEPSEQMKNLLDKLDIQRNVNNQNTKDTSDQDNLISNKISGSVTPNLYRPMTVSNENFTIFKYPEIPPEATHGNFNKTDSSNTLLTLQGESKNIDTIQTQSLEMFADSLEKQHKVQADDTQLTFNELHLYPFQRSSNVAANTDSYSRKSQRLFALSDFWEQDDNKSQEEILRIKLEEEKFRREHCENLIQELQKKLLEQQEKVAVAIRVDNEKNAVISQFQNSWMKLKQRWQNLDSEHNSLQIAFKNMTEKHQTEMTELQAQMKRYEGELSKALDLAAGYKEKSDSLVKERVDLLKNHADELQKYKTLVQQAEDRCDLTKSDYNKLSEKNQQLEEVVKNTQQELNKERLKSGEVRSEMAVIHKALNTCEVELNVLRQEKESLQLKIKEEISRNKILEQNKIALLAALDDAKKAEKIAKDEAHAIAEQQEKIRSELREVYQKQVDEVVKVKQQEFQTQLDSAEMTFQTEFEVRQRAIAECAARKIKNVIDKHQLEVNLLEEKHKEEKRLCELQIAQMVQKSAMLEAQLNSQQANKNQLVEQLHSVMQRQWQQALRIIAGGNVDNKASFQRINIDKFFEIKSPTNCDAVVNHCSYSCNDPVRLEPYPGNSSDACGIRSREGQHNESLLTLTSNDETNNKDSKNDLRGYIKMILDMQQSKDDQKKLKLVETTATPPPVYREVPKKHYTKNEFSVTSEDSVTWHPVSESTVHDISEYIPLSQKVLGRDQQKSKPPWK